MLGTGVAQLLPFAVTPILTRMYSEKEFALYTSFFAIAGILEVGAGGRYQFAIVIPKSNEKATKIFILSIYITLIYSVLLFLIVFLIPKNNLLKIDQVIYLIPIYVLFFGLWSSFSNLSIRYKTFKDNAIAKVLQSVSYILSSMGIGMSKYTIYGLLVGKILGLFSSWLFLFKKSKITTSTFRLNNLKLIAKEYIDYPKYGITPTFLNTISIQGIVLVLTNFYSTNDLGYFGLTTLVLSAPIGLIGASYKDVFYQKIAFLINTKENLTQAFDFFKKSAIALLALGTPICLIIFFLGPDIFSFVFGEKWIRSGEFASVLAVSFLIKLIASPLSSVFNAANKLRVASIWQTLYFFTTFSTLGISVYIFELDVDTLFLVYVAHESFLYILYLMLQYRTLKNLKKKK